MPEETPDTAQTNAGSEASDEDAKDLRTIVNIKGFCHLFGLEKSESETEEDFQKRVCMRVNDANRPKTKAEYDAELFGFLKDHFINRLCWWSVSNGGDDFEIEIIDACDPMFPSITIKVYPSGKPIV